jgi:hypothetical protein
MPLLWTFNTVFRFPFFVFRFSLKRPNHFGEFQAVFDAFESENDIRRPLRGAHKTL